MLLDKKMKFAEKLDIQIKIVYYSLQGKSKGEV